MPKTVVLQEPEDLRRLLAAPNINVKSLLDTFGEKILVNFENTEESAEPSNLTNVIVASTVTTHGRLMLLQLLILLGNRVCYYDTGTYTLLFM
jgi:hypothetical protein